MLGEIQRQHDRWVSPDAGMRPRIAKDPPHKAQAVPANELSYFMFMCSVASKSANSAQARIKQTLTSSFVSS